jgi:hypothetical protein
MAQPGEEFGLHASVKWSKGPPDRTTGPPLAGPLWTFRGIISGQSVGCSDSEPENLAETQGFEPWIRLWSV